MRGTKDAPCKKNDNANANSQQADSLATPAWLVSDTECILLKWDEWIDCETNWSKCKRFDRAKRKDGMLTNLLDENL
jgi:hypothetical protein